jgi:2-methylisocitrate lyase-like PEP mutase family enzyme
MNQAEKAERFAELHAKGKPLLLYNGWDAGSAKAILAAGATAIATSSWSVAEAQGYRDGEVIPIELVQRIVGRIAATIDAPVTVDFEGGYSENDSELANNISRLLDLGVIGINFEDRLVKGAGLYDVDRQARRISAIRKAAGRKGVGLFINARTDVFFEHSNDAAQAVAEALGRAKAYAVAGASGYFVPGLVDDALVELRGFEPMAIAACSRLSAVLQSMRIGPSLRPRRRLVKAVPVSTRIAASLLAAS